MSERHVDKIGITTAIVIIGVAVLFLLLGFQIYAIWVRNDAINKGTEQAKTLAEEVEAHTMDIPRQETKEYSLKVLEALEAVDRPEPFNAHDFYPRPRRP